MESAFRSFLTCLLLAFLVLTLSVGAFAQVSKGSISGTVVDPTGAIVPGAGVKATNAETNQATTTTSDSAGLFKLPLLSVGSYRVEITKAGFRKASLAGIGVTPGVDNRTGKHQIGGWIHLRNRRGHYRDAADRDDAVPDHEHIRHQ